MYNDCVNKKNNNHINNNKIKIKRKKKIDSNNHSYSVSRGENRNIEKGKDNKILNYSSIHKSINLHSKNKWENMNYLVLKN